MRQILEDIRNKLSEGAYKNEEHVRLSLVSGILHKLGWNIWNPKEVYSEFPVVPREDQSRVDLALFLTPNSPAVFIEIKAIGKLKGNISVIERQLRDYNRNNTALFSVITDGRNWRFYYSQTGGEFSNKCFNTFDIKDDDMDDIELFLHSFLSKSEIINGNAKADAESYLRSSQKERSMERAYPKALRMILNPPFLSLPQALVQLASDDGFSITHKEAIQYVEARQAKKPLEPIPEPIIPNSHISGIGDVVEPISRSIVISLSPTDVKNGHLTIPKKYLDLFPPKTPSRNHDKIKFTICDADEKEYNTHVEGNNRLPGLREFFRKNPKLKAKDKIYIDTIEIKKRYRLRTK